MGCLQIAREAARHTRLHTGLQKLDFCKHCGQSSIHRFVRPDDLPGLAYVVVPLHARVPLDAFSLCIKNTSEKGHLHCLQRPEMTRPLRCRMRAASPGALSANKPGPGPRPKGPNRDQGRPQYPRYTKCRWFCGLFVYNIGCTSGRTPRHTHNTPSEASVGPNENKRSTQPSPSEDLGPRGSRRLARFASLISACAGWRPNRALARMARRRPRFLARRAIQGRTSGKHGKCL